jgi:hypothetical protein
MTIHFTFSYIVVDKRARDVQGHALVGVYPFWIKNEEESLVRILRSTSPLITAKIYAGTPSPDFDYTEAVERRIKLDIQRNTDYSAVVAGQINDTKWHLDFTITPIPESELQ